MATERSTKDTSIEVASRHHRCYNTVDTNNGQGGASFECREHKGWQPQAEAHLSLQ